MIFERIFLIMKNEIKINKEEVVELDITYKIETGRFIYRVAGTLIYDER